MSVVEESPQVVSSIPQDYTKRLMVFGGRASMELAARIAGKLDVDLGHVDLRTFADGEVYCRYTESIRGADVFLVQSTAANEAHGMTPNDALMELLTMIDAAQGASAHRIIAVMPWYGYARQDKKSPPREPISARVVAKALEAVGVDRVLTMDLHSGQVQGFFEVPVDHMTAMPMLTQYFLDQAFDEELVIVSPDAGRVKIARNFARKVGTHWAVMEKERPAQQVAEIGYVVGDVEGKTAVLVDDMIDTAGTLMRRRPHGARRGRGAGHRLRHPRRLLRPGLRAAPLRGIGDRADRRHRHDPAPPRRARQHHGALDRADAGRLDPPHLRRRLRLGDLRRREPAVLAPGPRPAVGWRHSVGRLRGCLRGRRRGSSYGLAVCGCGIASSRGGGGFLRTASVEPRCRAPARTNAISRERVGRSSARHRVAPWTSAPSTGWS